MTLVDPAYDEFLAAATGALGATGGAGLHELGWTDVLAHLDDPEARLAAFALFRAQGRVLARTPALGELLALPYLEAMPGAPGSVAAAAHRHSTAGRVDVLVGDPDDTPVLLDRPGEGAAVVDVGEVELVPIDVTGRGTAHEVRISGPWTPTIPEDAAATARVESARLGRLAAASEILGAAETVLTMAIEYAGDRQQFGRPIGSFQAIRHLLAWAETDRVALDAVTLEALRLDGGAPDRFDEIVKALAGRNGRRICERALQTFGGIGFTAEHDHHHFHSRVLFLDSILGTSADLTHELGTWYRTTDAPPDLPAAVLAGGA